MFRSFLPSLHSFLLFFLESQLNRDFDKVIIISREVFLRRMQYLPRKLPSICIPTQLSRYSSSFILLSTVFSSCVAYKLPHKNFFQTRNYLFIRHISNRFLNRESNKNSYCKPTRFYCDQSKVRAENMASFSSVESPFIASHSHSSFVDVHAHVFHEDFLGDEDLVADRCREFGTYYSNLWHNSAELRVCFRSRTRSCKWIRASY